MAPEVKKIAEGIKIIRSMNNNQLAVTIILMVLSVALSFWFEKRYAKLVDTQNEIHSQQVDLDRQKTEINMLKVQLLTIVHTLPDEQRKKVLEQSALNTTLFSTPINNSRFIGQ